MEVHQDVLPYLTEAFNLCDLSEDKIQKISVNLNRIIGKQTCVPITKDDQTIYKIRKGRKWPSKFVLNREPIDTSYITMVIKKTKYDNIYRLITAYIGDKSEREEFDTNVTTEEEMKRVHEFWNNHALVDI